MPLFHFQVRTESHVLLAEAADLADSNLARLEAAQRVGNLLKEHAGRLWQDEEWRMDVTNDTGLILFVIQVSAMKAAAAPPTHPER